MAFTLNIRSLFLCGLTSCSITMFATTDNETNILNHNWQELKSRHLRLLPVPKRINFTASPIVISGKGAQPIAIVLKQDTERGRIAAAEITSRIAELAPGVKVPVGSVAPQAAYAIIIDNINSQLPAAPEGAKNCEQTYSLTPAENGITLAGQGETGMLYAAVTLRWLIERNGDEVVLYPATVYDWPDFTTRALPAPGQHTMPCYNFDYPSDPQKAFEKMKPMINYIFRMKGNCLMHTNTRWHKFSPYTAQAAFDSKELAATKLISDYARQRGITSFNYGKVSLGEAWSDANRPETKNMLYYKTHGEYHSWARHDLHRKKAEQMAQFCKDSGNTAFYIHAVDGGSIDNPEMWNDRDKLTKEKYGNDRVSADADMFNIYIDAFKQAGVNAWLVVYPYTGVYLNEDAGLKAIGLSDTPEQRAYVRKAIDKNKAWMQAINKRIPPNVPVCLRESKQDMMFDFMKQFPGRPMFIYYEVTNPGWDACPLLPPEVATFVTAYGAKRKNDILWCNMYGGGENIAVESIFGAISEFAWNTNFPGAHQLDRGNKEA
ncbi:MAG: glycoside hydrolase family 20 zincin-like fold domain-containing protein, partial [Victivallaceae bacterium]